MVEIALRRLTLVYPPALEAALVELLLEHEPRLPGFTTLRGQGHGADFEHASVRERVRGRIERGVLMIVLPLESVDAVLATLGAEFAHADVTWWLEAVLDYGRLA